MKLKLYNTLNKEKEEFKPINKKEVLVYTCGPTVYWYQHIGNMRAYIFSDILRRVLEYNRYKVKHIINITDVGHLTSDADSGEDKLESAAKKEGKDAQEIAKFYFNHFNNDLGKLNIKQPYKWTKATEHIKEQIEMIKLLEEKGYTYKTSDGIYFDTSKFKDYGKLSNKKPEKLEAGKRVSMGNKKNNTDFALWKFSDTQTKRQQEWVSPWGVGFPGWHIECSAMSTKYLGKQFDIHTGGEDHIHIHHENEIAQSECALNVHPWVKYWMHSAFLVFGQEKMSKSSGKIKTISQLEEEAIDPLAYRYFTYTAHYRKPLSWSNEAIKGAVNSYKRLKEIISKIKEDNKEINKNYIEKFEDSISDDLDMPKALAVLWEMLRDEKATGKIQTIKKMDEVFGLRLLNKEEIPSEIKSKLIEMDEAKMKGDFKTSDKIREELVRKGYKIKNTSNGSIASYALTIK